MLWLEADERDLVSRRAIKRMISAIPDFVGRFGNRFFIRECVERWQNDEGLFLSLRGNCERMVDLSFLRGVVEPDTLTIAHALKSYASQKSGFDVIGFSKEESDLLVIDREPFSGFESSNWRVARLGFLGYTVFVHINGFLAIRKFFIDDWMLYSSLLVKKSRVRRAGLFEGLDTLMRFLERVVGLEAKHVAVMAKTVYDRYRGLQKFRLGDDCQSDGRVLARIG